MSRNSELIFHLEATLKLAKEENKLVVPTDEIISTKNEFFCFPRRIFQKSTNKFVWRIGTIDNVTTIRHYSLGFIPECSDEIIFYENRYEIP